MKCDNKLLCLVALRRGRKFWRRRSHGSTSGSAVRATASRWRAENLLSIGSDAYTRKITLSRYLSHTAKVTLESQSRHVWDGAAPPIGPIPKFKLAN